MSVSSEYACEVVRVTEVLPHPDAERLELVHFEMKDSGPTAYTVVDGKGQNQPGDLRVYCSVDSVVPVAGPFDFLKARASGRPRHRIRAARLRGVYSEGLLVGGPEGSKYGTDLSEVLGVTKYLNPEEVLHSPTATGTGRRRGFRDLIYRNAWWKDKTLGGRMPEYTVVSLRKAPHTFMVGEQVEVTEKIHGANFRCGWINGRYTFGSHRTLREGDHRPWHARLLRVRSPIAQGPGYYKEPVFETVAGSLRDLTSRHAGLVFYGEVYGVTPNGRPIQDLTYGASGTQVRFFAVWDAERGEWVGPQRAMGYFLEAGLDPVPVLYSGEYRPGLAQEWAEGPSTVPGAPHIREGVVLKSLDRPGVHGKWVGEGYRMRKETA